MIIGIILLRADLQPHFALVKATVTNKFCNRLINFAIGELAVEKFAAEKKLQICNCFATGIAI